MAADVTQDLFLTAALQDSKLPEAVSHSHWTHSSVIPWCSVSSAAAAASPRQPHVLLVWRQHASQFSASLHRHLLGMACLHHDTRAVRLGLAQAGPARACSLLSHPHACIAAEGGILTAVPPKPPDEHPPATALPRCWRTLWRARMRRRIPRHTRR